VSVRDLATMTYPEVEALLADPGATTLALIPTGSTEAHGPHLPLATDSIICEEMARRACVRLDALGYASVRMPTLHYAVTDWAADFAGSVGVSRDCARLQLLETAARLCDMGFDGVVLVNAHLEPGNIETLRAATREFGDRDGPGTLIFPDKTRRKNAAKLSAEFQSGSCHAGRYETSLVLAVDPNLVRGALAAALEPHHVALHEHIARGAASFRDCGLDQAYCGDPAQGSAEEGHASYDALAEIVVDAVQAALPLR